MYTISSQRIAEIAAPHLALPKPIKGRYVERGSGRELTSGQVEVRDLALLNFSNKEMAARLGRSARSIASTMTIVLSQYKCKSRKELIALHHGKGL